MRSVLFLVLLAACDSEGEGPAQSAVDAAAGDAAERGGQDATPPVGPDGGPDAAGPDGPDAAGPDAAPPDAAVADAAPPDAAVGPTCPPPAPHGPDVGDVIPSLILPDCDGTPHDLQSLCGQVGFFFEFAAWCPPCRRFASQFEDFWAEFPQAQGFVVLSADENFAAPDADDCRRIRDQYDLPVTVLYDPEGQLARVFDVPTNDMAFVTARDGTLRFKRQYSTTEQKAAALRAALAE
jgi:peroxiredoxin